MKKSSSIEPGALLSVDWMVTLWDGRGGSGKERSFVRVRYLWALDVRDARDGCVSCVIVRMSGLVWVNEVEVRLLDVRRF